MASDDGEVRCWWCGTDPAYRQYHDLEWGFPVSDDQRLFEKLSLEGFQSGLSWLTILRKREAFRRAFAGFDLHEVARFGESDVARLLADAGIVRHRGKIEATIGNARLAVGLVAEKGALANYLWKFAPTAVERPERVVRAGIESQTPASQAMSRELKRLGFRFVGPTTCYAFMQAMGMVNDHVEGCPTGARVEEARRLFVRPG